MNANQKAARLLLVDGSNLLFQMFYGMPSRIVNASGRAIHGVLGFTGALLKILRRVSPSHVAVIFDGEHENVRRELDENYKANRTDYSLMPKEETPFSQLPDINLVLNAMGIVHAETLDCETDDLLAAYADTFDGEVIIASMDSDFFQLINDRVSVLRYRGENTVLCTPDYINEKFGISPNIYTDFKSLVGDHSDNLPGAIGVGPKTAARLLSKYGSLFGILAHIDAISPPKLRLSLSQSAERLKKNYEIIKLNTAVSVPFSEEQMRFWFDGTLTTHTLLSSIGIF